MIVGRAVNGWTKGWRPSRLLTQDAITEIVRETNECSETPRTMLWVTDHWGSQNKYNTGKSAFWRVVKSTVEQLHIADAANPEWPSHIAWSNLYKVSPEAGRNPNAALCKLQRGYAIELLGLEIKRLKPRRILFLTGLNWASKFLEHVGIRYRGIPLDYADARGSAVVEGVREASAVVVAKHPERKPHEPFMADVRAAFAMPGKA